MSAPNLSIEAFTGKVWNQAYPDRRPWDKLEPGTREEWVRVMRVAVNLYESHPDRSSEHMVRWTVE